MKIVLVNFVCILSENDQELFIRERHIWAIKYHNLDIVICIYSLFLEFLLCNKRSLLCKATFTPSIITRAWSSLDTHGSLVVIWWLCISSSGETRKFDFLSQIWPWGSRSITPQNNRDRNQVVVHLWYKFGNPSLNRSWVIARTSKWLTHRHTHTQTEATTIPEGQNWSRVKMQNSFYV